MKKSISKIVIIIGIIALFLSCQKSADEYYNSAYELVNEHKTKSSLQAISDLDNAIKISPTYARAYLLRAKAKFIIQHHKSLLAKSEHPPSHLLENVKSDPLFEKVISDFDKALELDANLLKEVRIGRGDVFIALEEYETAFTEFELVLQNDPNNKIIANSAVMCKFLMKDTLGGRLFLDKIIKQNPNDAENYYSRAVRKLISINDKDGACNDLKTALKLYDMNEKYLRDNLKEEIEKLLSINCVK